MAHAVILAGLGNIGSSVAALLCGLRGLCTLTLVDHDVYTEKNLGSQAIERDAIGRPKVDVQAERLRRAHPATRVEAVRDRLENLPLGRLQGAVIVACLDNRRARQTANRMTWRCGLAYIDGAVQAPSLGRVVVYRPGATNACAECGWGDDIYANMEQQFTCRAGEAEAAATDAPLALGALVAALQVVELRKLLDEVAPESSLVGAQYMLDTESYSSQWGRFARNEHCRFDHQIWQIESCDIDPAACDLDDLFDLSPGSTDPELRVDGHTFATCLDCVVCGRRSSVGLAVPLRLSHERLVCACGGRRLAPGFFSLSALRRSQLSAAQRRLKLGALGLVSDDVVSIVAAQGQLRHIRLGTTDNPKASHG